MAEDVRDFDVFINLTPNNILRDTGGVIASPAALPRNPSYLILIIKFVMSKNYLIVRVERVLETRLQRAGRVAEEEAVWGSAPDVAARGRGKEIVSTTAGQP
jgi:hypothetical protein